MRNNGLRKLFAGLSAACIAAAAMPVVSFAAETEVSSVVGDANCDGSVDMSDVVLIMQSLANPNKYGLNGSDRTHMTEQGQANADVHKRGNGVTSNDALAIQLKLLNVISSLPTDQV